MSSTPAYSPATYTIALDSYTILNTRSRHEDTNYVTFTVKAGDQLAQTKTLKMGDQNNGTYPVNLSFDVPLNDPHIPLSYAYLIVNSGHSDPNSLIQAMEQSAVAYAALEAGQAGAAIPVVGAVAGPVFVAAVEWVGQILMKLAYADCDGIVAAGSGVYTAQQLWAATIATPYKPVPSTTDHPGSDSPAGCGSNSHYQVTCSVLVQAIADIPPPIGIPQPPPGIHIEPGSGVLGVCPAGGGHDWRNSPEHTLATAAVPGLLAMQHDWHRCRKCRGLFFAGNKTDGVCPAGGHHDRSGSPDYHLAYETRPPAGHAPPAPHGWLACHKCQGLYATANQKSSRCPAGGVHEAPAGAGSHVYTLDPRGHNVAEEGHWFACHNCHGLYFVGQLETPQ